MITIRNSAADLKIINFPDGQPHICLTKEIKWGDEIRLVWPIRNPTELFELAQIADALDGLGAIKQQLVIPYLMGARFDRRMHPGDSFDLRVVAEVINHCGFADVNLFDVHSDTATALIKNSRSHNNSKLVEIYSRPDAILICPDAGAAKKIGDYHKWNSNIVDTVYCIKRRELSTGAITLKVLEPERCQDRNCVIIDDLCDGGATFLAIAEQIQPLNLTLIVTHGIFSKGLIKLSQVFDQIITSDSYQDMTTFTCDKLHVIRLNL